MTTHLDSLRTGERAATLEELDREIGRLAMLCRVPLLEPGVIDRVLGNDATVCASDNPPAFAKLRSLLIMHLTLHGRWAADIGEANTAAIERAVIERLRKSLPDLGDAWPPS